MKQKTVDIDKKTLKKLYEDATNHTESVQNLVDRKIRSEDDRALYCIAKGYQNLEDGYYDPTVQILQAAIDYIKREYLQGGK